VWTPFLNVTGGPPQPRAYHVAASTRLFLAGPLSSPLVHTLVVMGGIGSDGVELGDTWLLRVTPGADGLSGSWVRPVSANPGPFPRYGHGSALAGSTFYVLGGRSLASARAGDMGRSDLWALNLDTLAWSNLGLQAAGYGMAAVWARWNPTAGSDAQMGMMGGTRLGAALLNLTVAASGVWTVAPFTNVTETSALAGPTRLYAASAYSPDTDTLFLFGGLNTSARAAPGAGDIPAAGLPFVHITSATPADAVLGGVFAVGVTPALAPERVDCVVGPWSDYGTCAVVPSFRAGSFCSENPRTRTRSVVVAPRNGGAACPPLSESVPCGRRPCLADGVTRWAVVEEVPDFDTLADLELMGTASGTEAGVLASLGTYLRPAGASSLYDLTAQMQMRSTLAAPPDGVPEANETTRHSYGILRAISGAVSPLLTPSTLPNRILGVFASVGNGTDAATACASNSAANVGGSTILGYPSYFPGYGTESNRLAIAGTFSSQTTLSLDAPMAGTLSVSASDPNSTSNDAYVLGMDLLVTDAAQTGLSVVSSGAFAWLTSIGGSGAEVVTAAVFLPQTIADGALLIGGFFNGSSAIFGGACGAVSNFESESPNTTIGSDAFVARLNAGTGACEWVAFVGGNGSQALTGLTVVGSTVIAVGTSRSNGIVAGLAGDLTPGNNRTVRHAYAFAGSTWLNTNRTDGFVVLLSADTGLVSNATLLLAGSDTSRVVPSAVLATPLYSTTNASVVGVAVTIGGGYAGEARWQLLTGMALTNGARVATNSTRSNVTDAFLARYELRTATTSTVAWVMTGAATSTSPVTETAIVALTNAPSARSSVAGAVNGTVHALLSYSAASASSTVNPVLNMTGVGTQRSLVATASRGGAFLVSVRAQAATIAYTSAYVTSASVPGNQLPPTHITPALVASDRQVIWGGAVPTSLGLNYTVNASSSTSVARTSSLASEAASAMGLTASAMDPFYVSVTSLDTTSAPLWCVYGDWSEWTQCRRNCSTSMRSRTRPLLQAAVNGGYCIEIPVEYTGCGDMPCLHDVTWVSTSDTAGGDGVGAVVGTPDGTGVITVPAFRARNETGVAGSGSYTLAVTRLDAPSGSQTWQRQLNGTAVDTAAFPIPFVSAAAAGGTGASTVLVLGGTARAVADVGAVSPIGLAGGALAALVTGNGDLIGSVAFGSNFSGPVGARGYAVAYSSAAAGTAFVGGRYVGNLTASVFTAALGTTDVAPLRSVDGGAYPTAAVVAVVPPPDALTPLRVAWNATFPAAAGVFSAVTGLATSLDGLVVYAAALVSRSRTAPADIVFTVPGSRPNASDTNLTLPHTDTNNTLGSGPNASDTNLTLTLPTDTNITLTLPTEQREYVVVAAFAADTGALLWVTRVADIGPTNGSDVGPVRDSRPASATLGVGPSVSIAVGEEGVLFLATSYRAQAAFVPFGDASAGSGIPPCNYAGGAGACGLLLAIDAGASGAPLRATTLQPGSGETGGTVAVVGVSTAAGAVVVTGTFTTHVITMSGGLLTRGNGTRLADVFLATYAAEDICNAAGQFSLFATTAAFRVTAQSAAVFSSNAATIYLGVTAAQGNVTAAHTFALSSVGQVCHSTCFTCSRGTSPTACITCRAGTFRTAAGRCSASCPAGEYADSTSGACAACSRSCNTCSGPGAGDCTSCAGNTTSPSLLVGGVCTANCTAFAASAGAPVLSNCYGTNTCVALDALLPPRPAGVLCACDASCYSCSGPSRDQCLSCPGDRLLFRNASAGTSRCIAPIDCYWGAGYAATDNTTGVPICALYSCPGSENVTEFWDIPGARCVVVPSPTPTPSATASVTPTPTTTSTFSAGASPSSTPSPTPTISTTPSVTSTSSETPTPSTSVGASRSVTPTASITPQALNVSANATAVPSVQGTPSVTMTPLPSITPNPNVTTLPGVSRMPNATYPINCTLGDEFGNWSRSCVDACAQSRSSPIITRSRPVLAEAINGGTCPPLTSPERTQTVICSCPSPSRTPLPPPVSTCFNNAFDGSESDTDCGGSAGCPRCAAGRRCLTTLDCMGDASNATLAFFARYNYTGQAFVCSSTGSAAGSVGAAATAGVCTDARLSRSVYGTNTTVVPAFVEFKIALDGIPSSVPAGVVVDLVRSSVWRSLNSTSPALAALLLQESIIITASASRELAAASASPSASAQARGNSSSSGNSTSSPGANATAAGNATASATAAATAATTASPTTSTSPSATPSSAAINGTSINGTVSGNSTMGGNGTMGGNSTMGGNNGTSIGGGGCTGTNCTGNSTLSGNSTAGGTNSTNGTSRRLYAPPSTGLRRPAVAGAAPSTLWSSSSSSSSSSLRRLSGSSSSSSFTFTVRILLPDTVNASVVASEMSTVAANFSSSVASFVASSLVAANYSLSLPVLSAGLLPASGGNTTLFYVTEPLPPLVEKASGGGGGGVVPGPVEAAESGGGGGAGAAAAIIILLLVFFGVAYFYVRRTGSFLGCTFGPLATCFGKWPLSPAAEERRAAVARGRKKKAPLGSAPADDVETGNSSASKSASDSEPSGGVQIRANPFAAAAARANRNGGRQEFEPVGAKQPPAAVLAPPPPLPTLQPPTAAPFHAPTPPTLPPPPLAPFQGGSAVVANPLYAAQEAGAAVTIQHAFRVHRDRRASEASQIGARAGKAALMATTDESRATAHNVMVAAGKVEAANAAAQKADAVSAMTSSSSSSSSHGGRAKKKKQMSDLEAAVLLQRVYKGHKLRQALRGWVKVVDDDGDVFFKNESTGSLEWVLPQMPFAPPPDEDGEAAEDGEEEEAAEDTWYDEDGDLWHLDGPGGKRLAWGWRRCSDGDDVWYVNDDQGESSWEPVYLEDADEEDAEEDD
jgi:hypothetical protein